MSSSKKQTETLRRILIIDDNPDIHKDYAEILSHEADLARLDELEQELFGFQKPQSPQGAPNFELDFACQGQEGIAKIRQALDRRRPFQLAFVDMRMPPGWDGLKTTQEIWKIDPKIQIVLCTAYSDYTWEEINQNLGFTENLLILKKPFDASEVAQLAFTLTQKWLLAEETEFRNEELERLVTKRTKALKESNQQLMQEMAERRALEEQLIRSQKMEAIGTLAAGVAHDLNNILTGILTYPDLLLMNRPSDDPMYHPLCVIRQSGRKAAAIVKDMLTLSRRDVSVQEPISLSAVVRAFIDSPECRGICERHPDIRIETQCEPDLPLVSGSAVHLETVVMNLISNAAEAMEQGGTIGVDLRREQLKDALPGYETIKPGQYVKLSVSDQGTGIDQEDVNHIFEPFFTKKKLGRNGTGLGMTVVADTVSRHHGAIKTGSKMGKGTTISIYLPVTDKVVPASKDNAKENLHGNGDRILVVDDVAEQREVATAIFQTLGYQVDAVASGELALDYLEKKRMDLLLLDMTMDPGMDGLDTLKQVLAKYPGQKTVIASGYTNNERVQSALRLGATFIHKPYGLKEIAQVVKNALHSN